MPASQVWTLPLVLANVWEEKCLNPLKIPFSFSGLLKSLGRDAQAPR